MNYYTYAYLREDRTPYYIGKGEKDRIYKKGKGEIKPPKDKSRVIFLKQNLTEAEAFRHEIYMIVVFGRKDLGTGILRNRTNGGEGCSGLIHTPEHRAKNSASKRGKKHHNYGKTHSPETKAKISAAQKGKVGKTHSAETKAKISAAKKGKTLSPETKAKISAAKKGNTYTKGKTHSAETKAKISAAKKGKTHSPEHKAKLSAVQKGKIHSQESKEKMSAAKKDRIWITNGIQSRIIPKNGIIPEGFRKGMTLAKLPQETSAGSLKAL